MRSLRPNGPSGIMLHGKPALQMDFEFSNMPSDSFPTESRTKKGMRKTSE